MKKLLLIATLISSVGCHNRLSNPEHSTAQNPTVSDKFYTVACCGDYVGPQMTFVYPSFLPADHVSLCKRANIANNKVGPDEYIDGAIYLAMGVDCGHGHYDIGDQYYPPTGY